jgi:hypothetical protein
MLTICACYWWEMALNNGLDVPFDDTKDWKGVREGEQENSVVSMYEYATNAHLPLNSRLVII